LSSTKVPWGKDDTISAVAKYELLEADA